MSQSARLAESPSPPPAIRRGLRAVDLRLRSAASGRGLGIVATVASLASGLGMAADFAWNLPDAARWAIWATWTASVVGLGAWCVVRPILKRSSWIDLAAVAERADPRLGERITGSVALLESSTPAHGSPALIAALADDAAGHLASFDPSRIRPRGKPRAWLAAGLAAVALVVAPGLVRPDPFRTVALRFFAPWMDLERVGRLAIEVRPGDAVAAIGADFAVEARVTARFDSGTLPEAATLEWVDAKGGSHRAPMTARADESGSTKPARAFQATLPALASGVDYRVSTDSARTRAYRVTAMEPPKACEFTARVEPPAYTGLAASNAGDPSRVEAVEGSRVVFTFYSCLPFRDYEMTWPSGSPAAPSKLEGQSSGDWKHATIAADALASGPFVLTLRHSYRDNIDGLPEARQLVVRPDLAPTMALKGPPSPGEARPDDVLQVMVAARDDFAVASCELHYEIRKATAGDSKPGHVEVKLEGQGTPTARGVASVPLRDLGLEVGDSLTYRVVVADNRPAPKGPNQTWSDSRSIAISAKAEPMIAKDDRIRRESFQARLDEIRVANASNRRETEQLRYAADAAQRNGQAWDAGRDADLGAREVEARAVEDKLQLLARDLLGDPTFEPLGRPTRQAAEVEAEAGRAQLEQARKATESAKRLAELRQADARLGSLGNRLDEIRRRFDALAKLDVDRQKLRDLAAKEDALADKADEASEADKARLAAEQEELRKALDALMAQSPLLRAGQLGAQADVAARLAKAARALAEKQRLESRKTAEAPRASDPLREIARAQKEIEDDARRLALEVDDPLAENGRGRLDTDAVKRPVEPIERGDLPEAVRKLDEAEDSLRRLARDVEDVPQDPRALARRLARRQEWLSNDVAATLGEARRKDNLPEPEKAALVERSKGLIDRQAEIARLASGLVAPEPQKDAAREAIRAADRALENLRDFKPRESEERQNNARRALNQLADALPDHDRLRGEARRKLDEARRKEEEVLRDLERHLSETRPQPDKPDADDRAAADLAEKIAPLIPRAKEAAEALGKLEVEPRMAPQRDRAAARALRLARQIQAVKDQAPPRRPEARSTPPGRWNLLGPFPSMKPATPFDVAASVDLARPIKTPDGKTYEWRAAQPEGDEGKINLGQIFDKKDNQAAFAVAEFVSPARRKVPLSIGSDDTLVVWLNGKQVFSFDGARAFAPGQDRAEVELLEGVNRLAVRCGNGNNDWQFAVNLPPTPPAGFDPDLAARLRETLASTRVDALASLDRLDRKSQGKMPADDLAATLAGEARAAAEALALERSKPPESDPTPRQQAAQDRQRLAMAIRNLPVVPESPALHAEALRLLEAAAPLGADPKLAADAADALEALARRLGETLSPPGAGRGPRPVGARPADPRSPGRPRPARRPPQGHRRRAVAPDRRPGRAGPEPRSRRAGRPRGRRARRAGQDARRPGPDRRGPGQGLRGAGEDGRRPGPRPRPREGRGRRKEARRAPGRPGRPGPRARPRPGGPGRRPRPSPAPGPRAAPERDGRAGRPPAGPPPRVAGPRARPGRAPRPGQGAERPVAVAGQLRRRAGRRAGPPGDGEGGRAARPGAARPGPRRPAPGRRPRRAGRPRRRGFRRRTPGRGRRHRRPRRRQLQGQLQRPGRRPGVAPGDLPAALPVQARLRRLQGRRPPDAPGRRLLEDRRPGRAGQERPRRPPHRRARPRQPQRHRPGRRQGRGRPLRPPGPRSQEDRPPVGRAPRPPPDRDPPALQGPLPRRLQPPDPALLPRDRRRRGQGGEALNREQTPRTGTSRPSDADRL